MASATSAITTDSAHVATAADSTEENECSVVTLLQAAGTSNNLAVPQPTQAPDKSNSTSKETTKNAIATTTESPDEQEGSLSTNNYN
jgi:hypothetical protein